MFEKYRKLGIEKNAEGNKPLLIGASRRVWLVLEGKIDIFLVRAEKGDSPLGIRKHLAHAQKGGSGPRTGRGGDYRSIWQFCKI